MFVEVRGGERVCECRNNVESRVWYWLYECRCMLRFRDYMCVGILWG